MSFHEYCSRSTGRGPALTLLETLAHELRQPLSAIESTAYYLAMVLPRSERRAQEQASRLQRLTEQASWILSCALQLADTSPLAPEPLDLEELITQSVAGAVPRWRRRRGSIWPATFLPLRLDPGRARWLVENLLAMMRRAADRAHPVQRADLARNQPWRAWLWNFQRISLRTRAAKGPKSCLGAGAAMGIESARRIVEAHGGSFDIEFDSASAVRVRILFPENLCTRVDPRIAGTANRYKRGVTMKVPLHGCRGSRHFGSNCGAKARLAGALETSPGRA